MKQAENHILVIFGASGDLTKRKLIPAIFDLHLQNLLPEKFAILGVSRTNLSDNDFRERMLEFLPKDKKQQKEIDKFICPPLFATVAGSLASKVTTTS